MTKALTKRDVDGLEPREKPYVTWDPGLQGFGVRVTKNGPKTFVVKVRVGRGRFAEQRWITIGRYGPLTLDKAHAEARLVIAHAMTGNEPASRPKVTELKVMTVADLCKKWLETGALRSRALGKRHGELCDPANVNVDRGRVYAHILPLIGKVKLQELGRRNITALRDQIANGTTAKNEKTKPRGKRVVRGGDGTATRTVRLISSILSFGVREGYLKANPAIGVETTPDKARERFLSDEVAVRLGKAIAEAESFADFASPLKMAADQKDQPPRIDVAAQRTGTAAAHACGRHLPIHRARSGPHNRRRCSVPNRRTGAPGPHRQSERAPRSTIGLSTPCTAPRARVAGRRARQRCPRKRAKHAIPRHARRPAARPRVGSPKDAVTGRARCPQPRPFGARRARGHGGAWR